MKLAIEALKRGQYLPIVASGLVGAAIGWVVAEVLVYQLFDKKNKIEYIDVEVPVGYDSGTEEKNYAPSPVIMTKSEREKAVIKVNYAEKFKEGKLQPIPPKDETMIDDPEPEDDVFETGPYVITEEEYEGNNEASKYHWLYYEDDDVLTDDKDRIVPDYEDNIGIEALCCFGESSNDPDIVYIQNDDENAVYEIIRIHSSFEAMVSGTVAAKVKDKNSTKKRKKKVAPPLEDVDEE